jgi:hypothetical protein
VAQTEEGQGREAKAPDFGAWVEKLAKTDAPPTAGGLPVPPKDTAQRAIASLGKSPSDKTLAALLADLGIDLKKYKTAGSQRHLLVPKHGYSLSFEKQKLRGVEFTNAAYESWDYVNGKDAKFTAFPHEILKCVKVTDKLAVMKKKLGKAAEESPELGTYYWNFPGKVRLLVACVDPDETDGPLKPGAVQYLHFGVK